MTVACGRSCSTGAASSLFSRLAERTGLGFRESDMCMQPGKRARTFSVREMRCPSSSAACLSGSGSQAAILACAASLMTCASRLTGSASSPRYCTSSRTCAQHPRRLVAQPPTSPPTGRCRDSSLQMMGASHYICMGASLDICTTNDEEPQPPALWIMHCAGAAWAGAGQGWGGEGGGSAP